jgi:hypothetical protein
MTMKRNKILVLVLAILFASAMATFAANIPNTEKPTEGPAIWSVPVFNNSGYTLDYGDCVVWNFASSTGSDDNYVTYGTQATAGTYLTAGIIISDSIADQGEGLMAIRGVVTADTGGETYAAGEAVTCGGTGGVYKNNNNVFTTATATILGITTAANSGSTVKVYVNPR